MKGGLRFHPSVNEEEVESLASLMTWKTALLRTWGAKGGVVCDPRLLSESELEHVTKTYIYKIKEMIGPYLDIPAPDVNTNAQVMAWIMSAYSRYFGYTPAVVTGKPTYLHGSQGREEATGTGVAFITKKLLELNHDVMSNQKVVVQGFGNVGFFAAKVLSEMGAKIIAVSNVDAGLYNEDGLNITLLQSHIEEMGSFDGFDHGQVLERDEILTVPCDVLIPCALGDVFDKGLAKEVETRYIVEGANGPSSPEADQIFKKRNIIVVPDILANAGGVVVSYLEWVQNIQQFHWNLEKVNKEMERLMSSAFHRVNIVAKNEHCTLREAAYILGLGRVAKASVTLGL